MNDENSRKQDSSGPAETRLQNTLKVAAETGFLDDRRNERSHDEDRGRGEMGYRERSRTVFPENLVRRNRTIQTPAKQITDNMPASSAQVNIGRDNRLARRYRRLASLV